MTTDNDLDTQHSEQIVIGPPGTGKTTWLSKQVNLATDRDITSMVCSLTRAAAAEVAGRNLPIPFENVGTLHSHCFNSLGRPLIAEAKLHLEDWNKNFPHYALQGMRTRTVDEDNLEPPTGGPGDDLMSLYQIHRAKMDQNYPERVKRFAQAWTDWKQSNNLLDFTDLIETCLRDVEQAHVKPQALFVDEAQDLDILQMRLIRKWGAMADHLVIVGDPDQNIYAWRGSDPKAFDPPNNALVRRSLLGQSYRLPMAVHRHAIGWINQAANRSRVNYRPRNSQGEVRSLDANFNQPDRLLADADPYIQQGMSVMFLTSCAYMLETLLVTLRTEGIPFHNPHRRTNGAWNPLQKRLYQVTAADRILAFMNMSEEGFWTAENIRHWTEALQVKGILPKKGRDLIKELQNDDEGTVSTALIDQILSEEAVEAGLIGDLDFYETNLLSQRKQASQFPLTVVRKHGPAKLDEQPQVIPGTIHSSKGAEADVVYLCPEISRAAADEWNGTADEKASVYRLFYVGMTRAKHALVLCQPSSGGHEVNLE